MTSLRQDQGELPYDIPYIKNVKRNDTNELMVAGGKDRGRASQGFGDGHEHTAVFKTDNQQDPSVLLYNTGNSAPCYVAAWVGGKFGRTDTCMCMAETLCCPPETITTLLIGYAPI